MMKRSVHAVKYNHYLLPSPPLNFTLQTRKHRLLFYALPCTCTFAHSLPFIHGGPSWPSRLGHTPTHVLGATLGATSSGGSPWLPCPPSGPTAPLRPGELLLRNHSQSAGHVGHFVVGLSVFLANLASRWTSWKQGLCLIFFHSLVSVLCLALQKLRGHLLLSSELHGLGWRVSLSWGREVGCLGWEQKNAEQSGKAAESALVIKRKTDPVASLPLPFWSSFDLKWKRLMVTGQPFHEGWPHLSPSAEDGQVQHAGGMDAKTHVSHPGG